MRILVTGAAGMLGRDVVAATQNAGHDAIGLARADLDITDAAAAEHAIATARPDALINCAAWTDVDGAEADEAQASAVNGAGAGQVANAAAAAGALTIQVSSDYVFDGTTSKPIPEDAAVRPISAYGRSKLAGERAVARAGGRWMIVRSSWLFGAHGPNFVAAMLRLAGEREEIAVVEDQVGCPTYTGHLAPALVELAESSAEGIHHVAGAGAASWNALAREIFAQAGLGTRVLPSSTAEQNRPAPRPAYSVLGVTRPDTPRLPAWTDGLTAYLAEREAEVHA